MAHRTTSQLEEAVDLFRSVPSHVGTIELVTRRPRPGEREILDEAELTAALGLVGDNWNERGSRHSADGSAEPDRQLTLMNVRFGRFVAVEADRMPLAGDQLYVDYDIGVVNAPAGTRLALGTAVIEVTAAPHTGCPKFSARFGVDALRFVHSPVGRELRLRGVNAKVVVDGTIRPGDTITKQHGAGRDDGTEQGDS